MKDYFKQLRNPEIHYRQKLQEHMNLVERKKRIQLEAMENLGEDKQELSLMKTDDIDSEEMDVFERVSNFKELQQRFEQHKTMNMSLRGNDLRFNVYLKKMNKLTRKDLGLDIEGYKDYVNHLEMFAKFNSDIDNLN